VVNGRHESAFRLFYALIGRRTGERRCQFAIFSTPVSLNVFSMTHTPRVANNRAVYESAWKAQRYSWWLRYTAPLEAHFQAYYAERYHEHMKIGLGIGALAMIFSTFEDFLIPAGLRDIPLLIRFGLVLPLVCLLFMLIRRRELARWQQPILMFTTLGGAFSFMLMAFFVPSPEGQIYIHTLMLVQIFGLVLLRMQFAYAISVVFIIAIGVGVALFNFSFFGSPADHFIEVMLIVFAGILCLVGNYLIERSARLDFLQQRLLEFGQEDLEASNAHLQDLLRSDALTGISNRRHFDQHISDEFRRAERSNYSIALLMLDVDCFKPYNDTYGHQAGDEALIKVAKIIATFARRPGDVAARYGGEEFALILPGSNEVDALEIAEEIVASVYAQNLPHKASSMSDRLTVSIGVAALQPDGKGRDEACLIANADQAMYLAKTTGRNRSKAWSAITENPE
jgi:diguanylate cyclase (GGDEF)-like protein